MPTTFQEVSSNQRKQGDLVDKYVFCVLSIVKSKTRKFLLLKSTHPM